MGVSGTGLAARDEVAKDGPEPHTGGHGCVGMVVHGNVRGLCSIDGLILYVTAHVPATVEGGGETFAGGFYLISRHVGGSDHEGAGILCELADVGDNGLCLCAHKFVVERWYAIPC